MLRFAEYYNLMESGNSDDIANQFISEVLSKYDYDVTGSDHLNCSWVTIEFCKWAKERGGENKAIWLSWPGEESLMNNPSLEEAAHIAPIYNGNIIDFTFGQFTQKNIPYKITPLNDWAKVYQKYGVGVDEHEGYPKVKIEDIDTLVSSGYCQTIHAPQLTSL